jgi:lysophospholipase L1-like esterase
VLRGQRRARRAVILACVLVLGLTAAGSLVALAPAAAPVGSRPTAVVTLGDSYISGEAGRWRGNSVDPLPGNDGTDRACAPQTLLCLPDKTRVYVDGTAADGCHRSDVAEVLSARLAVADRINIACSGAVTANILRARDGGVGQNGEAPQADQLLPIAQTHDVKMIVLSIGGNDLGFAGIVTSCSEAYLLAQGPCEAAQQQALEQRAPAVTAAVERAIDEIRAVMAQAGYTTADYRLVAQTYASVVPRARDARYPQGDLRRVIDGCPFYDADLDWARDRAVPEIGAVVGAAAHARGAEVLDMGDALDGHELCAKSDGEATLLSRPPAATSEWGRFVGLSTTLEGDLQEAFHPNAYAQLAFGRCLTRLFTRAPGDYACRGGARRTPASEILARG